MKRILSVLLALVMVIGMLPMSILSASAAEASETMTITAATGTVSGESISWTSGSLTFTANKNTSQTAIRTSDSDHFRLYVGFSVSIQCSAGNIKKIEWVSTESKYTVAPTGADGSVGTTSGTTITIVPTEESGTYTISNIAKQTRVKSITVTYEAASGETEAPCEHPNIQNVDAVAPTCTEDGNTAGKYCNDCDEYFDGYEVIPATGHNYVNGTCANCGEAEPSNGQWMLVTDATTLAAGDQIVIVASGFDVALSTNQKSNNRGQIAITKDGNVVEINDDVQILTLEAGSTSGTWAFNTGSGYLYAASSGSNHLKTQTTNDANGIWNVTINAEGVATIKATGANTRNWMRYNDASSLFSCYGSGQKDISIYKYTVVSGCIHEVAEDAWTIVTAATCETAGSKTGTCSKCGEPVEKEIPALGHNYSYNAEVGKMVCANCGNSFMNTIAEAKNFTDNTTVYYMKGIVTYVSGQTVYMQDETGGICVYFTDADNAAGIAVGDELLVWDTVKNYKGLIETDYTKSSEVQVLSSGNELPVREITIAELNADTSNEYLAERIKITGATIGMINSSGNTTLTVGTDTTNLYKASGLAANVSENDIVDVIAIVGCYNAYQLLVNPGTAATDVVVTTEGVPSDLPLSDISVAKAGTAGEFFKVKGVVTFVDGASVYMQDATAGIVARLATGVTAPAIGTEIEVIGAYDVYYGLIQLEGATFTEVSTGNTVAAKEVTLADLADNTYLSEKVSLKNVEVTVVGNYSSTYKNIDYTVSDGTNTIKLYRAPLADEANKLAVGDKIDVIAVLSTYNGYQLRVAAESDITKIVPTVRITHISLDAGKDALGFKAELNGIDPAEVTSYGFEFTVNGRTQVFKLDNALNKNDITARIYKIMGSKGGEKIITGRAFVVVNGVEISSESQSTSMKDTIVEVNKIFTTLSETQKAAVYGLYIKNEYNTKTIAAWLGETNNIEKWAPATEQATPAV